MTTPTITDVGAHESVFTRATGHAGLNDEQRSRVRVWSPSDPTRVRAATSVLGLPREELPLGDIKSRCKGDQGGEFFRGLLGELASLRHNVAVKCRAGDGSFTRDERQANGLSFGATRDMPGLLRAFNFPVQVREPADEHGNVRSITTDAAVLLTSAMATADVDQGYESVPTVVDSMVTDIDDVYPNTEVGAALDFGAQDPTETPKPLMETEAYREVGAGEDRFTGLTFKDGYQRAFSQAFIERAPGQVFAMLMDLGQGAREIMEWIGIGWLIDYWGSRGSNQQLHVLNLNRAAASLFSTTANTPGTRAPSGTRINNNRLEDPSDLALLRQRLVAMRNSRGLPVANYMDTILVPDVAWERAWAILRATMTPGVFNEPNFYGPGGPRATNLVSTPMLDVFNSTNQSWYGGRPRKQFLRKWAQRPEISMHGGADTLPYLNTREGMRVRIGWDMRLFAREYIYWVECLDGTVAPGGA